MTVAGRSRATRQGAAVDEALARADGFLTAQALHDQLRHAGESVGLTTVYRHLRRLADDGRVDVVIRADGEASYRLCGPGQSADSAHHHHLVCQECGRSVEVESPEVEAWAARVGADAGFRDITHTVEVFGICGRHRPPGRGAGRRGSPTAR
ncbi:MAG TPA: Fur family transcriptional regulator [Mycobacteriales bacterium]|nr:Fur family transcriptional regulator [Mycobacteriales bacterium]